ncbi:outer-membrane lipoprotein carrier protein [Betaproteobacteria bacterium]|nr:outer-membrane lipoprotein carrier protein [Betaproteobacteria bacterium]
MKKLIGGMLAASLLMIGNVARADDALTALRHFVATTQAAEGEFTQTVGSERAARRPQQADGRFAFARPGKFRWEYVQPYPQLLVGDGERLWSWDRDLNQVTVQLIGDALGATPAAILFGQVDLDREFELNNVADADGLAWVEARPKPQGGAESANRFELIRFGFAGERLQQVRLRDNFGQDTVIVFTRLDARALDGALFRFEPPAGADVIGDLPPRQ